MRQPRKTKKQSKQTLKTSIDFYNELKDDIRDGVDKQLGGSDKDLPKRLNAKGKKYYVLPLLEDRGLDTWEKIQAEYLLIMKKESKHSVVVRMSVEALVGEVSRRLVEYHKSLEKEKES